MDSAFKLGKIFGIQFRLHYSWFIIFILVTVSLIDPNWSSPLHWIVAIVTSLLFFASILAHELAHSLVGRGYGIPIKSITLFIFGGMAQMTKEARSAGAEFSMAAAGPACSLALGGLFYLISWFAVDISEPVAAGIQWLVFVNVALAVFNLIPGFPLDGGRVFRSLLWRFTNNYQRSTSIATRLGQGVGYLFIIGGIVVIFVHPPEVSWFSGLWLAFIGWFLQNAASASYRQLKWCENLSGLVAAQVMTADFSVVPIDVTIGRLIERYIFTTGRRYFVVVDAGSLQGVLTLQNIKSITRPNWSVTQIKDIMTPVDRLKVAYPDQDVLNILEQMDENNIDHMVVVSEGNVVGLVNRENIMNYLRTRSELNV
ncbi:site-2 protease family protein [Chloroflexota bacterium]